MKRWERQLTLNDNQFAAIDRHIDEHLDNYLDDLKALCRFQSVAAQSLQIEETAEATRDLLEKYGVSATIMPTNRFPVVYGEAAARRRQDAALLQPLRRPAGRAAGAVGVGRRSTPAVRDGNDLRARRRRRQGPHRLPAGGNRRAPGGHRRHALRGQVPDRGRGGDRLRQPRCVHRRRTRDLLQADGCLWEFGGVDYDGRPADLRRHARRPVRRAAVRRRPTATPTPGSAARCSPTPPGG